MQQAALRGSNMIALCDSGGYRRRESRLRRNEDIARRADARAAKAKHDKKEERRKKKGETAETRPSLSEEMYHFKKIFKHAVRQDVSKEQGEMFEDEGKQQFRRLRNLGVLGHQPAIVSNCAVDPITVEGVEEAIFQQKVGSTHKQIKTYREYKGKGGEDGILLLVKKAKVDARSCPRWRS